MTSFASSASQSQHGGPGPRLMTAATLEGDKVVNLRHELLGTVRDITIDVPTGEIAYVVMAHGGMFGVPDKLFAIPWKALRLDPINRCFILDLDLKGLTNAPELEHGHWPQQASDAQWVDELHRYFGAPQQRP